MKLSTVLLGLFLIVSCNGGGGGDSGGGGGGDKNPSNLTPLSSLSIISGRYNMNQTENYCVNLSGSLSEMVVLELDGNTFKLRTFGFGRQDCYGIVDYTLESRGIMTLSGDNEIITTAISATGEMLSDSIVTDANAASTCGISDWVKDTPRSIYLSSCDLWSNHSQLKWTSVSPKTGNIISYTTTAGSFNLYPIVEKPLFGVWSYTDDPTRGVDFSGQEDEQSFTTTIYTQLSSSFLAVLNGAGRDTTGLVAGNIYQCDVTVYVNNVSGDHDYDQYDDIGIIYVNASEIDTPLENVCLEQDNDCTSGICNYDGGHIYYRFADRLYVDYWAETNNDGGAYITDTFQ